MRPSSRPLSSTAAILTRDNRVAMQRLGYFPPAGKTIDRRKKQERGAGDPPGPRFLDMARPARFELATYGFVVINC